jgi:acetyltransferase-like isoleucine patch superfamily enzyme
MAGTVSLKQTLRLRHLLELLYNMVVTHVPSHAVRLAALRALGAEIGRTSTVFRGCRIDSARNLRLGERCVIGWNVVLDARGGITFGDDVIVASDCQFITAEHDVHARDFRDRYAPITVGRWAWIASRAMVMKGVSVGEGGVVAAGAVAVHDVAPYVVVGGVPARPIAERCRDLAYDPTYRPLGY